MKKILSIAALVLVLTGSAFAQHVTIEGEPCPLPIRNSADQESEATVTEITEFEMIGRIDEQYVAIMVDGNEKFVSIEDMNALLPKFDISVYPSGTDYEEIERGTSDEAKAFQEKLVELGYLKDADGQYGKGTISAVKKFQKEYGLPANGSATVETQMMVAQCLKGMTEADMVIEYPAPLTVEEKFGVIAENTDVDLSRFVSSRWALRFDEGAEAGVLDAGIVLGSYSNTTTDLSKMEIAAELKVLIEKNEETGMFDTVPVLVINAKGAYRPYIKGVTVGGIRVEDVSGTSGIEGISITETDTVRMDLETAEKLLSGVVVNGKNEDYELTLTEDEAVLSLLAETFGCDWEPPVTEEAETEDSEG